MLGLATIVLVLIGRSQIQDKEYLCNSIFLPQYKSSQRLLDSSCQRAIELYNRGVLDHKLENGKSFSTTIAWDLSFARRYAENLASGFSNIDSVIKAWMESPTHRDILLNEEFTKYGLSEYKGYYVLHLSS